LEGRSRRRNVAKPPPSTPHSDIAGVHEDERRNTDVSHELGEDAGDLRRAGELDKARPPHSDEKSRDDRTS
jgi:hypothetical protein